MADVDVVCINCDRSLADEDSPDWFCTTCMINRSENQTHEVEIRTTSSTGGQKGVKEERYDLIPVGPLRELANHYGRGALKYDDHQWRKGYEWGKSYASIGRHSSAFWSGEDYDVCPDDEMGCQTTHPKTGASTVRQLEHGRACYNHTGSHHMVAVAWHAFALLEFKDTFPEHDDRHKRR